jgi:dTDP-4-dehydrorhamnose reductase
VGDAVLRERARAAGRDAARAGRYPRGRIPPRLLHAACDDLVSRGELARRVPRGRARRRLIEETADRRAGQAAPRPLRGGLRNDRWKRLLGVERLPLDDALDDCLPRMKELYAGVP